jgi:hypothetical protein
MNLGQLAAAVYGDLGYTQGTPEVQTRTYRWLNEAHKKILRDPSLIGLRQIELSFSTVANQAMYGLPQAFERIDNIVQVSTSRRLRFMTMDRMKLIDPGNRTSGVPDFWGGPWWEPVFLEPASTGVWVVSTNAADTTQKVNFQGIKANGDIQALQQVSLNGTTRVAIQSAVTDFAWIMAWNIDGVAAGTVSLYDAATLGNELARLPIGATAVQYQQIRLWGTPGDVYVMTVQGVAEVTDLTNATDIPLIPPSFHDVLCAYARMKEYERTQDSTRYGAAQAEFIEGRDRLKAFVEWPSDYRPVAGSGSGIGLIWPNLSGGYWPADFLWG